MIISQSIASSNYSLGASFFIRPHPHNSALRFECFTSFRPAVCGVSRSHGDAIHPSSHAGTKGCDGESCGS
jgi:hypothetical protein